MFLFLWEPFFFLLYALALDYIHWAWNDLVISFRLNNFLLTLKVTGCLIITKVNQINNLRFLFFRVGKSYKIFSQILSISKQEYLNISHPWGLQTFLQGLVNYNNNKNNTKKKVWQYLTQTISLKLYSEINFCWPILVRMCKCLKCVDSI